MDNTYDLLEEKIKETFIKVSDDLVNRRITGDGPWTSAIKTALTELAYNEPYNYWVWANKNNCDDTINEWLYDMTWSESYDNKGQDFKTIHLILESEWNRNFLEIKYDFYKLLQGRAKHRVFLFQSSDVERIMNDLEEIIEKSIIAEKSDRYLLAGWNDNYGFTFRLHIKK